MSTGREPPSDEQAQQPAATEEPSPSIEAPQGDGAGSATGSGRGARIGVDSWVAQSGERLDLGTGWRGTLRRLDRRIGWWPKLFAAAAVGVVVGHEITNIGVQQVAFNSMLYAILSLGLNISVGWAGLLDLGYAAFYGMGAYGYALFSSTALGTAGTGGAHLSAGVIILIVTIGVGLIGMLIGLVALRLEGDYLAIVTLFVGLAFTEIVTNVKPAVLGGVNGIFGLDPLHTFGHAVTTTKGYYFVALGIVVALAAIMHLLDTSRTGRAWRALRDDPLAARAMTIPVNKLKVMAFAFGAMVGALAGVLFAADQASVSPSDFTIAVVILIYACLVLGGAGSIAGAIVGGVLITVLEQFLTSPTDSAYLFYGLMLGALVLKVRPWRYLVAVLAGIVLFGLAAHAIVHAISPAATAGQPGSGGWIGSLVSGWVIVPTNAATFGNVLFVVVIGLVLCIMQLHGIWRLMVVVPTVYLAACCWESRLVVNPAVTTQIMIGAVLIVTMAARPQGLLGARRVEVV
jgi:branched-chain amino acid transport system permease protein